MYVELTTASHPRVSVALVAAGYTMACLRYYSIIELYVCMFV